MPARVVQTIPLDQEHRTHLPTNEAAVHLLRAEQTLRMWFCLGRGPAGLRPIRVNGRLAWPVAEIKAVMGVK